MSKPKVGQTINLQQQARMRALAHVLIQNMDGRIIFWNVTAEKLYGWTKEEAISRVSHDLLKTVFAEPLEVIMSRVLKERTWDGELIHTSRDGQHIVVASHWELLQDEHGNPVGILDFYNDITEFKRIKKELQESGTKFRAFVEQIPNTIIYSAALDEKSTTLYISPQIMTILGYSQEEYKEDPDLWAKLIYPDDYERVMAELKHCHKTGEPFCSEYRIIRKDGQTIWLSDEAHIIKDEHDISLFLLGTNTDITKRKHAEEALKKRETELGIRKRELEEINTALKVLLKKREEDKAYFQETVITNVEEFILPYLEKLKKSQLTESQKACAEALEANLNEITSTFTRTLSSKAFNLTAHEIKIANLLKRGKTTKEVCELLGCSQCSVAFHRGNLRRKLGLKNKKTNLTSYLLDIE